MRLTEVLQYDTSGVESKSFYRKLEEMKSKSKHKKLVKKLQIKVENLKRTRVSKQERIECNRKLQAANQNNQELEVLILQGDEILANKKNALVENMLKS